jgi:hypothetical protein
MQIAVIFSEFAHWLENHMLPCMYKKIFGLECPGCGMQRSFIRLLYGDLPGSFGAYPALLTTISMFIFLVLHLKFKFKKGAIILTYLFVLNTFIVMFNYLINNVS